MDKNVGSHQNALENVGPPATAWEGRSGWSVFIFCILEVLALDNPRTAVYNKDKERRWPCKRLAPHQSSITKVMTATGWKRWAVISFCRYCHYRAKSAMQCQKWHARPEPTAPVDWRWRPEVQRLQQESCGIPPLLDEHREENFKKRPPMLISFQRTM